MKRECPACGADTRTAAAFCHSCGRRLESAAGGPAVAEHAPPSVRTSVHLLWLALGSYFVLLVGNLGLQLGEVDLDQLRAFQCVMLAAAVVGMQLASRRGAVPSLLAFVARPKLSLRLLGMIGVGVAAALAAAALLSVFVPMEDGAVMELYRAKGDAMSLALLDLCVIAPVLEETVFRGIVLGTFVPLFGPRGALWASSMMFATLHLTPLTFVHHTLLGYICARARLESGSMLLPVCIHAGYNAVVVLIAW